MKKVAKLRNRKIAVERKNANPSPGERLIIAILCKYRISYIREHCLPGMVNPKSRLNLYLDFFLPAYNLAIEFDGKHHFHAFNGVDELLRQQYNDRTKDRYLKSNGVPLLRIPYWDVLRCEELILEFVESHTNKKAP